MSEDRRDEIARQALNEIGMQMRAEAGCHPVFRSKTNLDLLLEVERLIRKAVAEIRRVRP